MNVNNGLGSPVYFYLQSTQHQFSATGSITGISNPTNARLRSNWAKREDYREVAVDIANQFETRFKNDLPGLLNKVDSEIHRLGNLCQTDKVSIILSPYTLGALETVRMCEIEEFIHRLRPGFVGKMAVHHAFRKRYDEEGDMSECASQEQIAGITSLHDKYQTISCFVAKLVLMRLEPEFSKLHLSEKQFRSALNKSTNVKFKPTQTEIELSYMIANAHIPKEMDQWFEKYKALFKRKGVKGEGLGARLREINFPKDMTVEQFQKLLLREGHRDMTCNMISLEVRGLGVQLQPYKSPITILRDQQSREVIRLSDDSSDDRLPPLSPVITLRDSFPYEDREIWDYSKTTMWKSDTTALPVIPDVPSMLTFDTASGNMVDTQIDLGTVRAVDFIMYELEQ